MKSMLTLFFCLFMQMCFASQPNWGWGPAITATLNGTTLNCSTIDPNTNNTVTTTISGVANYINNDGIVAYVTPAGTVGGITYDINTASFQTNTFSSNSGNTITNEDGIIAWVSAAGTVGGAVYHPGLASWQYNSFSSNTGNTILNNDGVIAWVSAAGTVGGALYDFTSNAWQYNNFSSNTGNTILNKDGIVAWVSAAGTVGGAVYDPTTSSWQYNNFSSSTGNTIVCSDGVIGFISAAGTVGAAVYDFNSQSWQYNNASSSSSNTNLTITEGTVYYNNSQGLQMYGYSGGSWSTGTTTTLQCKLFAEVVKFYPPIAGFRCLAIGASNFQYDAGDGHQIYRKWAWKQYNQIGTYFTALTVSNSSNNSQCSSSIFFPSAVNEINDNNKVNVYPNPIATNRKLQITSDNEIAEIKILAIEGSELFFKTLDSQDFIYEVDLNPLRLESQICIVQLKDIYSRIVYRKIVLQQK